MLCIILEIIDRMLRMRKKLLVNLRWNNEGKTDAQLIVYMYTCKDVITYKKLLIN